MLSFSEYLSGLKVDISGVRCQCFIRMYWVTHLILHQVILELKFDYAVTDTQGFLLELKCNYDGADTQRFLLELK